MASKARLRQTSLGSAVGRDDLPLELCWGHGDIWLSRCLQMSPLLWHLFRVQVHHLLVPYLRGSAEAGGGVVPGEMQPRRRAGKRPRYEGARRGGRSRSPPLAPLLAPRPPSPAWPGRVGSIARCHRHVGARTRGRHNPASPPASLESDI